MSILSSLYIGTSGMTADDGAISIVGDNISNTNTIGYKSDRASFADVLGGSLGDQRLGDGVRLGGAQTLFGQGTIQQTGNPLDLAINGNGFFVVKGSHQGEDGSFYTRDGQFSMDNNGYVVDSSGLRLQGYPISADGTMATTAGDLQLAGMTSPPAPTTTAGVSLSLNSADATPTAPWDPANPAATSNYNTSMTVYDSLGDAHQVQMYARNDGNGQWEWHAMVDGGDVTGGTKGTPTEIASGTLTFNSNGALQAQTTTASSASFIGATPNQAIKFDFGDDIASGGTGMTGTTQYATTDSVASLNIDGHGAGHLTDVSVDQDGTVEGTFDNGDKRALARVALAQFASNDGLQRTGDSMFAQTSASGQPLIDAAGTGGRGTIEGGALESSNVDLGNELVTMIAYQRAYQSNAKTVTTADEMLQTLDNMST